MLTLAHLVGCNILMAAVKLIVEVGALALPGVGEAIDGGTSKSDQAEAEHDPENHADIDFQPLQVLRPQK